MIVTINRMFVFILQISIFFRGIRMPSDRFAYSA